MSSRSIATWTPSRLHASELGAAYEPFVGDIGDWDAHERAADAAEAAGDLRFWVNNAGIDWVGAAHEIDAEHIEQGLRVLQLGPMFGACVAVRRMLPARAGSIVNVSSIQGIAAFPRYFVYDSAKAAILMLTKSIAVDYGPFGIRCNALLPGCIETPMTYATLPPEHGPRGSAEARRASSLRCCASGNPPRWPRSSRSCSRTARPM